MTAKIDIYRPGDEEEILKLFGRIFQEKRDMKRWRWENMENPRGVSLFSLLKESGRVNGHLCLQQTLFKAGRETLPAGQRINSMLAETHRRRGVFQALFEHLLEQARSNGFAFIYGFPNARSFRALEKIYPTRLVTRVPRYIKFYSGAAAAARIFRHPLLAPLKAGAAPALGGVLLLRNRRRADTGSVQAVQCFDERFDRLWEKAAPSLRVATVRDAEYLNWRYAHAPANYETLAYLQGKDVLGYIVLQAGRGKMGHVVDLLAVQEEHVVPALLGAADTYMRPRCEVLFCWCLDQGQVSRHLRRGGFFRLPGQTMLALSELRCSEEQAELFRNKANWYLMSGDSDYV